MRIHYPVVTARLQLVPFTATDGDVLYALESDPAVKQFTGGVLTRTATEQLLQHFISQVTETGLGAVAIKQKANGQIIGLCGLVPDGPDGELFFGLAQQAWGQGFATEACRGLLNAGFQQLALPRISAQVDPANVRSIRVLERLGMRLISKAPEPEAGPVELTYALIAAEWQQ